MRILSFTHWDITTSVSGWVGGGGGGEAGVGHIKKLSATVKTNLLIRQSNPASILYKSTAGRYRPVSYPDGPMTARCRFIKIACWETTFFALKHLASRNSNICAKKFLLCNKMIVIPSYNLFCVM